MYKKWLSCALSVLCSFCLFWGLYSNTLEVEASSYTGRTAITFNFSLYPSSQEASPSTLRATVIPSSGTPTNYSFSGNDIGLFDVDLRIPIVLNLKNMSDFETTNYFKLVTWDEDIQITGSTGSYSLVFEQLEFKGNSTSVANFLTYDEAVRTMGGVQTFAPVCYAKFHLSGRVTGATKVDFTCVLNAYYNVKDVTKEVYNTSAGTTVSDPQIHSDLEELNESTSAIEESVTSDTGGGLLATIKNFFGGFFSNLINSILGLFVPDSTYFSTWFDNLNTLLSAKLGMLYAPFDLLISTLNAVYSADTTEPGITFPGITWDGQTVIEPYTFYFSSLGEDFQNLRDAVYFATDVVFLFAFLHLLQKKIALVITGSEVNG